MEKTVVLNADYTFLNVVDWHKAIKMVVKGKVEVIKYAEKIIHNAERTIEMLIPKVIKLLKLVRAVYRNRVPYSNRNVMIRDNFTCQYCGSNNNLTVDHVIPKSAGGRKDFDNCVTACNGCNNKKANKTPREAGMRLIRQPHQPTINEFLQLRIKTMGFNDVMADLIN